MKQKWLDQLQNYGVGSGHKEVAWKTAKYIAAEIIATFEERWNQQLERKNGKN